MPNANTYLPPTVVTPGMLLITNITQTNPMVVTITDSDKNTYIVGQVVHLNVPRTYGMSQADQLLGQITKIDGTNFSLNIDATQFDQFVIPASGKEQPASLAPAGSKNLQFDNSTNQVPFKSLNNQGN